MGTRATCYSCHRAFDLAPEAATPERRCQYCGGELSLWRSMGEPAPSSAERREAVLAPCPACDQPLRFEPGQRQVTCTRCHVEAIEPERPGQPARVSPPPVTTKLPPIAVPCAHCGGRGRMAVDSPHPDVRCEQCQRALTAAYLPLEKWADIRGLAQPGTLADSLLFILRSRWNYGTVSPGEVLRHVEGLRLVTHWLQTAAGERKSDFPLPVGATAEILKYFILRVDKAEVQSQSTERAILVVPADQPEPAPEDVGSDAPLPAPPALIVSIGQVPEGSVFGFLARREDGSTAPLAPERLGELQGMITAAAPRTTFRFLTYRFLFGEWIRPVTMAVVPAVVTTREMHNLGIPDARAKQILERLSG